MGHLGSIPGLGRSPGEGKGYPLQYSGLKNSIDCIVHGVAKSQIGLSDFHIHTCFWRMEWQPTPVSSILAWRIPMDREDWQATVHEVTKSWSQLKRISIVDLQCFRCSTVRKILKILNNFQKFYVNF